MPERVIFAPCELAINKENKFLNFSSLITTIFLTSLSDHQSHHQTPNPAPGTQKHKEILKIRLNY